MVRKFRYIKQKSNEKIRELIYNRIPGILVEEYHYKASEYLISLNETLENEALYYYLYHVNNVLSKLSESEKNYLNLLIIYKLSEIIIYIYINI